MMAGIYVHIPYCKQACHYCDFHFSTNQKSKDAMIQAMLVEINLQKNYLNDPIQTIYFGGGTPSILNGRELTKLIEVIFSNFQIADDPEITIEANPDDLSIKMISELKSTAINRLSIGIQSFDDKRLAYINRAHNKSEALNSIKHAQDAGFENLSIDLIYAIPPDDMGYWEWDLNMAVGLQVPHISLYGLTIEPKTVFGNWSSAGKFKEVDEDMAAQQYRYAIDFLKASNFEHYEVANFAKAAYRSKHNNAYWNQQHYLGIGPGAHSFNGHSRQFNVRNNSQYINNISGNSVVPFELETLSHQQKLNEYLLTRLRTTEGIQLEELSVSYDFELLKEKNKELDKLKRQGLVKCDSNSIKLSNDGFMVADEIALLLFLED